MLISAHFALIPRKFPVLCNIFADILEISGGFHFCAKYQDLSAPLKGLKAVSVCSIQKNKKN